MWGKVTLCRLGQLVSLLAALFAAPPAAAWQPDRPVELIVPAGSGGGSDQMARLLQRLIASHGLLQHPVLVINKSGGAGAEGFLHMRASAGNPHKLLMAFSNLFTTPLASGLPFSYRDLTPVGMLALDQFVLWVNARSPYASAQDFFAAVRAAPDFAFSVGGTGLKQEDQLLAIALEKQLGRKLSYVSFRGGGEVAAQLAGRRVSCSVNNPLEAAERWAAGDLRPLCTFRVDPMPSSKAPPSERSWSGIPTCKAAGVELEYQMLRGVFMPSGIPAEVAAFYTGLLRRVRALPEWRDFIDQAALDDRFLTGAAFGEWLDRAHAFHERWMREANLLPEPRR